MSKAAIYARLSNENEASTSTKRQDKECRQHAERLGLTVVETFTDEGISGYSGKRRPAFEEAIQQLEAGLFDTLIVWKLDRLTRQGMGAIGLLIDRLEGTGRRIVSVMDGVDTSNSQGRIMVALLSEMARSESANTSVRIKAAHREAREAGRWISGSTAPWGFIRTPEGKLAHNPELEAVAYEVVAMALNGTSLRQICLQLNERGIPPRRGKAWTGTSLRHWFRSPTVAGLQPHWVDGEVTLYRSPETGEPVSIGEGYATEAEWQQILEGLAARRKTSANKKGHTPRRSGQYLTKIARCGRCGGPLSSSSNRYTCNGAASGKALCGGMSIERKIIEPHIETLLINCIMSLEPNDPSLVRVAEAWRGEIEPTKPGVDPSQLDELEARLNTLMDDHYSKNRFAGREEMFERLFADLSVKIEKVKSQLEDAPTANTSQHYVDFSDPEVVRMAWDHARPEDRRAVTAALIDTITVLPRVKGRSNGDRVVVTWRSDHEKVA